MANYYVDETLGNDPGTGAIGDPWQTIAKVNGEAFNASDNIYFKCGEEWREKLTVPSSGSNGSPITFGTYGTGALPKILRSVAKNLVGDWTNEGGNIWFTASASIIHNLIYDSEASEAIMVKLKASLNVQGEGWYDDPNDRIYVYSVGNPATFYGGVIEIALRDYGIDINDKAYITIDEIDLRYIGNNAIYARNFGAGSNLIVKNCNFKFIGSNLSGDAHFDGRGIYMYIYNNCSILDNMFEYTFTSICPRSDGTARVVTVDGNICFNHHGDDGNTDSINFGGTAITDWNGSVVSNNDVSGFIDDGIDLFYASNVIVRNNIIHDIKVGSTGNGNGIKGGGVSGGLHSIGNQILRNFIYNINAGTMKTAIHGNGCENILVAYNIAFDCDEGYVDGSLTAGGENDNPQIYNNVFYNMANMGIKINGGIDTDNRKIATVANNICDGTNDDISIADWVNCSGGHNCLVNDAAVTESANANYTGTNDLGATDPLFVDARGHNFHIQPYSPCAFAGIDVGLTEDYEGNPVGAVPNIGAYEFRKSTDVLLGPAGAMVKLPHLMWLKGSPPTWSVSSNKQMEMATMMDKSKRVAFFDVKRECNIGLAYLSKAQLDIMTTLNALNQILYFVNNNEDARCYEVVISSFRHEPERMDIRQLERYKIEMTLKEI